MKLKLYFMLLAFLGAVSLQSCDNDDDSVSVSPQLRKALADKYPGATRIEWEPEAGYYVADFWHNNYETSAWFETDGTWYMTETDISYKDLPDAVQTTFQKEYSTWRLDDVGKIERPNAETVYVIEVEQGNKELHLRYSPDGVRIQK